METTMFKYLTMENTRSYMDVLPDLLYLAKWKGYHAKFEDISLNRSSVSERKTLTMNIEIRDIISYCRVIAP